MAKVSGMCDDAVYSTTGSVNDRGKVCDIIHLFVLCTFQRFNRFIFSITTYELIPVVKSFLKL